MSRYNTQVLSNIRMLCRMQNIDEKVLYERAKLILSIYREVCWSTILLPLSLKTVQFQTSIMLLTYTPSLQSRIIYIQIKTVT